MSSIVIQSDEWPMIAGMIGLVRLFKKTNHPVEMTDHGVVITDFHLKEISKLYFHYFLAEYSVANRETEKLEKSFEFLKRAKNSNEPFKQMREIIQTNVKRIEKYFDGTNEYYRLKQLSDEFKQFDPDNDRNKIQSSISLFENLMKTPEFDQKLTLNYVKAVIISPYFGQPSFLQPSCNLLDLEGHIQRFFKDYVQEAIWELEFKRIYENEETAKESLHSFLSEREQYSPFKQLLKQTKKLGSLKEIRAFVEEEWLPCSLIENMYGAHSFEEMMFSPLGISKNKAVNFYWNFDKNVPFPISALAKLILFLAPVGLAIYQRKIGFGNQSAYLQYGGLVLVNGDFAKLYSFNERFRNIRKGQSSFDESITDLLSEASTVVAQKGQSFTFIEVYSDYKSKKTLLDYYHMPTYVEQFFRKYGDRLKYVRPKEFKDFFTRETLLGQEQKYTIYRALRDLIDNPTRSFSTINLIEARVHIQQFRKGGKEEDMSRTSWKIREIHGYGKKIREKAEGKSPDKGNHTSTDHYRAPGKKKIEAVAYRLLNSAKSGNRSQFLDTVIRLHMGMNMDIPTKLVIALESDNEIDFDTLAMAFIAGLLANPVERTKKEEVKNE